MEEKYIKAMQKIYEKYKIDNEALHIHLDGLLLYILKENGYNKVVELYKKMEKTFWYA